jgi:cysteinyl-tRNA synthetase
MRFYNTLTRTVESFTPLNPEEVRIYCCGPTVYNYQHIGNLRTYIFEDTLVRALRYKGYKVRHVMNITDVGHLVSDADEGEDKMLVAAKREGKRSEDLAKFYTDIFLEHCKWLNISRPDVICKATDHIPEMIEMIRTLESKGYAYITGGNVYFDVAKFPNYGELARLNLDDLQAGARIEVDENKRSPYDFVLWFTKSKFENQELQWDSPWGRGYPGWHIECSAMARRYLGDEFDIHCGGIDHIPVHHTNEIAQSCGATGCAPARFWMHGNFLVVGTDKMSKSTGEFLTLDLLKDRGFDPLAFRLLCFSSSYRSELTWSWEALEGAANSLKRIRNQVGLIKEKSTEIDRTISAPALEHKREFDEAISEDLSLPRAIAVLHKVLSAFDLEAGEKLSLLDHFDQVLGLSLLEERAEEIPAEAAELAARRAQARKDKNFGEADRLRDELLALGFIIEDTKDGWKVKKI